MSIKYMLFLIQVMEVETLEQLQEVKKIMILFTKMKWFMILVDE